MKIGTKIRDIRLLKKLSQDNIATELGISQKAYSDIEADKTNITISTLEKLSSLFEMRLEDILNFNSDKIFHQYNNKTADAYGSVQNINLENKESLKELKFQYKSQISDLKEEIKFLRELMIKKE